MRLKCISWAGILSALGVAVIGAAVRGQNGPPRMGLNARPTVMHVVETPYYILHTDLEEAGAREADLRMTRMFEEYRRRTSDFAGQINRKFPFFLYRHEADYLAAGGPKGSVGVFMPQRDGGTLMAIAGDKPDADTWHVVQHEGFHQFVAASFKFDLPIWVNEGLAEYFGESRWTGDAFVSGLIPPDRLDDIRTEIRRNQFKPFKTMMAMSDWEWGDHLTYSNYDQAWAMVHFLAHADNGRYQAPFLAYLKKVSKGEVAPIAWAEVFGQDTEGFQRQFVNWWMALPDNPTRAGYLRVVVQTSTSYLARASLQRLTFPDAMNFFEKYQPAGMTLTRDLWLPPALFDEMKRVAPGAGDWTLQNSNTGQRLVLVTPDGIKLTGAFITQGGKVAQVAVDVTEAGGH